MSTETSSASERAETLTIQGPDALDFAHSQFSSDVRALQPGHWQFSAWLNAQGRVRLFFQLARLDDQTLMLLLRGGSADQFKQSLQPFVFRSKVHLTTRSDQFIADAPALPLHAIDATDPVGPDGTALSWGCGDHGMQLLTGLPDSTHWRLRQIRLGWPWLPQALLDGELLPTAISLMRLQAASLDKGCYPGQEIVARLHYRGGSKRHLHSVSLPFRSPADGVLRTEQGHPVVLLDSVPTGAETEGLAVIPDQALTALTSEAALHCENGIDARVVRSWPD